MNVKDSRNSNFLFFTWLLCLPLLISGCSSTSTSTAEPSGGSRYSQEHDSAPDRKIDFDSIPDAVPKAEPLSRYGNPLTYVVRGKRYRRLTTSQGYIEQGIASWYGSKFHGHRTSSGETFDMFALTAAHKTLPLPTYARVTNLNNGRSIIVKVNDRGPFHDDRVIDLSYAAAGKLGILRQGTGRVEIVALGPANSDTTSAPTDEPEKRFSLFVQAGAFSEHINAVNLKKRLTRTINDIRIVSVKTGSSIVYRVQVGPFTSEEEAQSLNQQLIDHGISGTVVVNEQI